MKVKDAILAVNASLLGAKDITELFDLILRTVLPAIDHANVACVLMLGPDGMLRIISSYGYPENQLPDFRVRLEDTFQWKKSGGQLDETLIINDLQRFMRELGINTDILKDDDGFDIRSTMSTPLIVDGNFLGLLNLDSRNDNVFDEVDRILVEVIRSQIPIAIKMFKNFAQIRELLAEKELLIREVHHRIKNNMSTIAGILNIRASSTADPSAAAVLEDACRQVQSMTMLYEKLYISNYSGTLPAAAIISPLIDDIVNNFRNPIPITVEKRFGDFILTEFRLQPFCIILNEILTNTMKYAFQEKTEGSIEITAKKEQGVIRLDISDDGIGLPRSIDFDHSEGFGLMLVRSLAAQMKGSVRFERGTGTRFILEIPD